MYFVNSCSFSARSDSFYRLGLWQLHKNTHDIKFAEYKPYFWGEGGHKAKCYQTERGFAVEAIQKNPLIS